MIMMRYKNNNGAKRVLRSATFYTRDQPAIQHVHFQRDDTFERTLWSITPRKSKWVGMARATTAAKLLFSFNMQYFNQTHHEKQLFRRI